MPSAGYSRGSTNKYLWGCASEPADDYIIGVGNITERTILTRDGRKWRTAPEIGALRQPETRLRVRRPQPPGI
jgi:hypothetical protein